MATYQIIQINNDESETNVKQFVESPAPQPTLGGTIASLMFITDLQHYAVLLDE